MKTKYYAFGVAIALLATSALAFAAIDGLSVKRLPKEGQEFKVRIKAEFEISGTLASYTGLMAEKITKVDTDGSFTEEERQIEAKAKFGDQEVQIPDTGGHVTTYNPDGSLKSIQADDKSGASGPDGYRMVNLGIVIDAGKPLNVGDTWSVDIKQDTKTGVVAAKAEYKVLAEEKVGTWDAVKIAAKVKETEGSQPASSDATYWISKADGSIVKGEVKFLNAPYPGAPGPLAATISIMREG